MGGMYGGGMPQQPTGALPQNIMQQSPGDISGQRDRITQALMDVQNPPPVTPMAQQQGMPAATGAPPMAGAMPGAAAPQAMGGMPGQMPAGATPGQLPPMVGQGGAMPGMMQGPLGQMGGGASSWNSAWGPQSQLGDIARAQGGTNPTGGPTY